MVGMGFYNMVDCSEGEFMPAAFSCTQYSDVENTTSVVFFAFAALIMAGLFGLRLSLAILGVLILGIVLRPSIPIISNGALTA